MSSTREAWLGPGPLTLESGRGLTVRVYRDIGEVEPAEWDSLLGPGDLLMSHRFVLACQRAGIEDAVFWHILIYDGEELVGVATLHRMSVNLELLSGGLTRQLVGRVKGRWPGFLRLPVLFCGLPVSCGEPCLKISPRADFEEVCSAVVGAMERAAAASSARLLCLKEFAPEPAGRMDFLSSRGYFRAPSMPSCSVPLSWDSFPSYLASMRAGYRRQVQSSLRARRQTGLSARRLDDCAAQAETIYGLYSQTARRAKQRLETLNPEFFRLVDVCLGEQAQVILLEQGGRARAMALMLFGGDVATFLFAGMEEGRRPEWQLYQNLLAEVVAAAIEAGARRLELGQTSYEMKSRMGAEESPRYLFLRYRGRVRHSLLRGFSGALFPTHEYPRRRVFAR